MRLNHYLGGILLVTGTTVGAAMLALPVVTSFVGFIPSIIIFCLCWLVMLCTSYFFLDVNLASEGESNFISMVSQTVGTSGKVVSWIVYLLLLYSLTAAYIAASTPIFSEVITYLTGYTLPSYLISFALPLIFGGFLYFGTFGIDFVNRFFMFGLTLSYLLLVVVLPSHTQVHLLAHSDIKSAYIAIPVIISSFGYHIIIPSLTTYMKRDKKKLQSILFIGSLIPLIVYIVWLWLAVGTVPLNGADGLAQAYYKGESIAQSLGAIAHSEWVRLGIRFFSFFAIVTSFLGVSLSLSDFLRDGLKLKKGVKGKLLAYLLTFTPPLVFVFSYQKGFILALNYAAIFVAILLIFLPAMMAWKLKTNAFYRSLKGRILLIAVMIFSIFIVGVSLFKQWN